MSKNSADYTYKELLDLFYKTELDTATKKELIALRRHLYHFIAPTNLSKHDHKNEGRKPIFLSMVASINAELNQRSNKRLSLTAIGIAITAILLELIPGLYMWLRNCGC